jgi:hypothetical protein
VHTAMLACCQLGCCSLLLSLHGGVGGLIGSTLSAMTRDMQLLQGWLLYRSAAAWQAMQSTQTTLCPGDAPVLPLLLVWRGQLTHMMSLPSSSSSPSRVATVWLLFRLLPWPSSVPERPHLWQRRGPPLR